jgi:hypothetical protein
VKPIASASCSYILKISGCTYAHYRQVMARRCQVLADRQHIDVVGTQVSQHFEDLVVALTEADHQSRFGRHLRIACLEAFDESQRMRVIGTGPSLAIQARHRFQVVVEDVGQRLPQDLDGDLHAAPEIGNQRLDGRVGRPATHFGNHLDEMLCAAITQVIAVDAGDHHVAKLESGNAVGKMGRLVDIGRQRLAMTDVTERAATRTDVAEDHEGRRTAAETFANVRTSGFFTDGMQLLFAQHFLDFTEATRIVARLDPNPVRLALWRLRDDLDRNAGRFQFTPFLDAGDPGTCSCHPLPCLPIILTAHRLRSSCSTRCPASAVAACAGVSAMPRSRVCVTGRPG